nr:sensory neuron membrane protein 4 [Tyrophagus putrescentiae]
MASSSAEESTTRPWSQEVQPTQPIARDNRTTQSFGSNQQQQQQQQGRAQANIHVNEAEINSIVTGKDEQVKVVSSEEEEEEEDHQKVLQHHQPEILSVVRTTVEEYCSPDSDTESLDSRKGSGAPIIRSPSSPAKYHLPKRKRHWLRGVIVLLVSLLMFLRQDWLIQSSMDLVLAELKEGSFLTANWANIPIPINLCFYLFGLKNAPEFLRGAKPYLEEHGPFCYIISRKRRILEWKKDSVTYMERIGFQFNEEASEILNKFYVGFMGSLVYNSIALTLRWSGETWLERITARTFLDARPVPLLAILHRVLLPLRTVGIPVPDEFGADGFKLLNHSFGLTTTLSSGELGPFEVFTRTEGGHLLGDIISFKESSEFPGLSSPCNRMTGGDGMFWKRPVVDDRLTIFLQPTCGLLPFVKEYDHLLYGAQVVRYKLDDQWWNMSEESSRCFCQKANLADCQGWHDISPCVGGIAPMGFTLPHFYRSPNLAEQVEGLSPDPELHSTYLDMEPVLGAPVNAKIGIQGVVAFGPVEQVPLMAKLPRCMFPLMWLQVAAGAEGVLGIGLGIGSNFVRYGSWLWLILGLPLAARYFYRERRQRRARLLQFPH